MGGSSRASRVRPRLAGFLWSLAAWMKWIPALFLFVLAPRARLWGIGWLAASVLLSLATLPLTIIQLDALFGFGPRPVRLDYLVFLWALVPWLWRREERRERAEERESPPVRGLSSKRCRPTSPRNSYPIRTSAKADSSTCSAAPSVSPPVNVSAATT